MKIHTFENVSNLSATVAYFGIYGRVPHEGYLPNSTDAEEDEWCEIKKDKHLKNKWLDVLNNIENIKVLSTCEGHNRYFPTHIIIEVLREDLTSDEIYNRLQKITNPRLRGTRVVAVNTKIGICYCITYYSWYRPLFNNYKWEQWWINIIPHIHIAINKRG